jgi:CRISPR-associated protein Cas2
MFYLVCFDIVDDRKRLHAVKILKKYGYRVQKSVFECPNLTEKQFLKMKQRIEDNINCIEDSVRYYFLSRDCIWRVEISGIGEKPKIERFQVI